MKIKKIDFKSYTEKECAGKTAYEREKVIFECPRSVIISDYEFIHQSNDLITDSIRVYVCPVSEDENSFYIMPTGYYAEQLSVLLENCDVEEINPQDFFRNPKYNSRLSSNFKELCKSLTDAGMEQTEIKELTELLSERNKG